MFKLLKLFKLMRLFKLWKMLKLLKKFKQLIRMLKVLSRMFNSLLSADPVPLASGSLPSEEVQLMAQIAQNVNLSSSTMGSVAGASNFLVSQLPTPNTIPSYTPPPPPPMKTTNKLPNMSGLFDSLNTFVTANKEKAEASSAAPPAKPSRAEKLASRALRVTTRTYKIVCVLADWTVKVHAPRLAIPPPIFDKPSNFDSESSFDSGTLLHEYFLNFLPIIFADD